MVLANTYNEGQVSAELMTTQLMSNVSQQCLQFRYRTSTNAILRYSTVCVYGLVNLSQESLLALEFL